MNVVLDKAPAEVVKPSAIAEASQDTQGTAKIGVRDNNAFPEKPLTAAKVIPVEQPKTAIPQDFVGKEILAVKKSVQVAMVESVPDLLATKSPAPEKPEDKEKSFAPTPSVAKPLVAASPVEKLVGTEAVPGEKQQKIIFAESAPVKPPVEKPESIPPESKTVKVEEPKMVEVEKPKPVEIEKSKPAAPEKRKLVNIDEPKPVTVAEPPPVKVEEPHPEKADEAKPARSEVAAETRIRPVEAGKSDEFRTGTPAYKIPSLAELSIASVRKFASDTDRRIKFGERRKTISLREQDFRYAMYVESVRLKLQRIGMFNFPAAAAKGNLSGTLAMVISIRADGSLEEFRVIQPSVYEALNKGAENIVRMSAPFSVLPDNIRQETDILSIKINWSFSESSQSFD